MRQHFFIQLEAFEFEAETLAGQIETGSGEHETDFGPFETNFAELELGLGEIGNETSGYETGLGEFEADFDELEALSAKAPMMWEVPSSGPANRPKPPMNCPKDYDKGEVQKSRTAQGHLPSDVIVDPRGLLIADFGIDERTPRESLKRDGVLQGWLRKMGEVIRANPATEIRILGFSDCVGDAKYNNNFLRQGRAVRVPPLLNQMLGNGPQWNSIKSKIIFTGGAPPGKYVFDNNTAVGRAKNRSVLIEHNIVTVDDPTIVTARSRCLFRPSLHGFKFVNSFTLPSAVTGLISRLGVPIGSGPYPYGLCGGMSLLAADHFRFGVPIPATASIPGTGTSLYNKILVRQLDSLALSLDLLKLKTLNALLSLTTNIRLPLTPSLGAPVLKFHRWMGLPDRGAGSTAALTLAEFRGASAALRRGTPIVLGLVRKRYPGDSLLDNHQVLAYCMLSPSPTRFEIYIYDPNCPLRDDIKIEVNVVGGEALCTHVVCNQTGGLDRERIRGFFVMPYSPKRP